MYLRRRRRLPITAWLIPLILAVGVVAAIVFDYREVHRTFDVFGTRVDTHTVRQVLVQPSPENPNPNQPKIYKISAHNQVVSILQSLSSATPSSKGTSFINNALVEDNVFIQFESNSWQLQVLQDPLSKEIYLQYNGQLFRVSRDFLQTVQPQT